MGKVGTPTKGVSARGSGVGGMNDIGLHHQVVLNEVNWKVVVGINATNYGGGQINVAWPLGC